jgi:outer membrane protein assembly factor BamB
MHGDQGLCAFCGTAIERPKTAQSPHPARAPQAAPAVVAGPTIPRAAFAKPKRGNSCLGALIMLITLAAIGCGVGQAVTAGQLFSGVADALNGAGGLPAALSRIKLGPITELVTVLPRDGKGGDLLVYAYGISDSRYTVALIDGATQAARWQSQPLSKEAYQGRLVTGHNMVYLTDQERLIALRMSDGTQAWQSSLDVEPQTGCAECLRLIGNHLIVLEKNGGLQAFDAQTGKPAWSMRLTDQPRQLPVVSDRLVTTQPSEDKDGTIISFLDPATGKAALKLDPHCTKPNQFAELERPASDTPFMFSADGKTMYTVYGFFSKCAQAFDLTSGKPRWEVPIDDKLVPSSWYNTTTLLTEQELFFTKDDKILALDTANGDVHTLIENKDYRLRPLALHDSTLIVLAAPTWDSRRQALWGVDAASGERHWQEPLQAHELRQGSSSGDWDWQLTPSGLQVIQVLRDQAHLLVETLNPRTGDSASKQEIALTDLHSPSLYRALWTEDTAWLKLDSKVYAIDLATGKTVYQL